jgi:hypothetical protein
LPRGATISGKTKPPIDIKAHPPIWHEVGDSREGWAKALELWEVMTFEKVHREKLLVLDFSKVRCKGSPIAGMQNRPASGPVPLMGAFAKAATLKGAGMPRWKQAMYVDHYFAECVLVGGARRAARMATKHWSDPSVLEFIQIKRPIEFVGLDVAQVAELRKKGRPNAFLWSSNNSVTVDAEFWLHLDVPDSSERSRHAWNVFNLICDCAYGDGTGEPGIINSHKLQQNDAGWTDLNRGDYVGSAKYQIEDDTQILLSKLAKRAKKKRYHTIVNPCGEVALNLLGGYCVIADGVPFHADSLDEAEDALRASTRALIRTNTMDCLYAKEVARTIRLVRRCHRREPVAHAFQAQLVDEQSHSAIPPIANLACHTEKLVAIRWLTTPKRLRDYVFYADLQRLGVVGTRTGPQAAVAHPCGGLSDHRPVVCALV